MNLLKSLSATLLLAASLQANAAEPQYIDAATLEKLQAQGVPVIDIRTETEWRDTGIIPGSRLLTFFDAQGQANPAAWLAQIKPLGGPEKPVILTCRSGNRTRAAAQFLTQQAGYKTVYHLQRGIGGWKSEGKPLLPAAPQLAKCTPDRLC